MTSARSGDVLQPTVLSADFAAVVQAEIDGTATDDDLALLEANERAWLDALWDLLADLEDDLDAVREMKGPDRAQIVADFESERTEINSAVKRVRRRVFGEEAEPEADDKNEDELATSGLQLSWIPGHVVAWVGGPRTSPGTVDEIRESLVAAGAPAAGWEPHDPVPLPGGGRADSLIATTNDVLGWLVAVGAKAETENITASLGWLGQVAVLAVDHTARGSMVPQLAPAKVPRGKRQSGRNAYMVRWTPALSDPRELERLATALPGAATAFDRQADRRTVAQGALADLVDAICKTAARQVTVPAPPPEPRTTADVAESFLTRLDGSHFEAPTKAGGEVVRRLDQWAKPVTSPSKSRLVVQLQPPDSGNAWHLSVLAPGQDGNLEPVEVARVTASTNRRKEVRDSLKRLEQLLPVLLRPGSHRVGEVVLSQDEAWELMTVTGPTLAAAGFDVRVPALSRRKPTAALRLTTDDAQESVVGAQQLADVRWSAVFDDVELDVGEIQRLAAQAKPLVKSRGKWVELDHADLAEAAAALAERADQKQLTGAEMLRHALGLEGSPLSGGLSLAGGGWAADLLESAQNIPADPPTSPDGFEGELRHYQAEALGWLQFLDSASLGGCLALDMGLGKTPTMLAHLHSTRDEGPSLAVLPPAVVGNWAAEAEKFTPDLRVVTHHGQNRASAREFEKLAAGADVVLTTYGTAVRDIDTIETVDWNCVVLDEAQIIKNPTSDTAQQLRRIPARTRLALTGTPIENGLGDLWAIMDFANPGLVGARAPFISALSVTGDKKAGAESALKALNGILVFRRTKAEPVIAAELPDRIDELDHCTMTSEQIGLYQAVLDSLVIDENEPGVERKGHILAAITALKQICNHPVAYQDDGKPLAGRSGKLTRLDEIIEAVFAADERVLVFTHFAKWGEKLSAHITERTGIETSCYHGGLARGARDRLVDEFQSGTGPGAMVLSLKAGGTGLNLTAASHVVLYDRWWNPAVEDQARDRVWRIGQTKTVIAHRLVCPGTVDERVEEVVAGKRRIADMVLPKSSSLSDLDNDQLRTALGLEADTLLVDDNGDAAILEEAS